MSALPPVPPRPSRTNARSPAPVPAGSGNASTLGSDIPIIPPRPKRRIDRSPSPSKSQTSATDDSPVATTSINILTHDPSDLVREKPSAPPANLQLPDLTTGEEIEHEQDQTPLHETRGIPDDLEVKAPAPKLPENADTAETQKLAAITRTDSAGAAELHIKEQLQGESLSAAQAPQLRPETNHAIVESLEDTAPLQEMDEQLEGVDSGGVEGQEEADIKPTEVNDDVVVHVSTSKDEAAAEPSVPKHEDCIQDVVLDYKEIQRQEDNSSNLEPILALETSTYEPTASPVEYDTSTAHDNSPCIRNSHVLAEDIIADDKDNDSSIRREANIVHDISVLKVKSPEGDEQEKPDSCTDMNEVDEVLGEPTEPVTLAELKGESAIIYSSESNEGSPSEASQAPNEETRTDKNEADEILGEPAEPVILTELRRESATIDRRESTEGVTPKVLQTSQPSLDTASDFKGEHLDTHISEERPTTGAVAFHQEKQAEGIPLSYEEGRATTGVASIIKPAIPPRPAKKVPDPNTKPILVSVLPQADGPALAPAPEDRSSALPSGPKPPVPVASKPAIPPRPARPPRPIKKDSLTGCEGAPLTTVSSASSARSLFEARGSEAVAAAKAKSKPPVPARPIGSKIAALQGGFLSELNRKLKIGPALPAKEEPEEEEVKEVKEVKPLADARKGRARGPARRAPAKVEKVKEVHQPAATPAVVTQSFSISAPITVWEASPADGDIRLPSRAATPKNEIIGEGNEPETVVKNEAHSVIETKPEFATEALKVTPQEIGQLEDAQEDSHATTPPVSQEPQQQEAESSSSSWTGTTALGALAMSAQEVIAETATQASKTVKDFTEDEEHVLSDVEDQDSPAPSDTDSVPASPKQEAAQNEGLSEVESKAEQFAAPEHIEPVRSAIPCETDFPVVEDEEKVKAEEVKHDEEKTGVQLD